MLTMGISETMFFKCASSLIFILLTPLLSSRGSPLSPKNCIADKSERTRIFSTLAEYQSTKESFDVNQQGYKGNIVAFSFKSIDRIEKNAFISFGSESIIELILDHKNITTLEVGAFLGLYCLQTLDLSYNNIVNISEGVFDGLSNLVKLDMSNNLLESIPDNGLAFYALKCIKVLDLSNNQIKTLSRLSFAPLTNLEVLNLSFNKIRHLDGTIFNSLGYLKILLLSNNHLSTISPEDWEGVENLATLDLSKNYLTSFDTSYNFTFMDLKTLNLSGNYLTSFNALAMRKSLPRLQVLDINNNKFFCGDLVILRHFLVDAQTTIHDDGCLNAREDFKPPAEVEKEVTTAATTTVTSAIKKEDTNVNISAKFEELLYVSKKMDQDLSHVENILMFFFLFVVLVLLIDIVIRVGGCRVLTRRCSSEERDFLDSGNIENMTLIRR